GGTTPIVSRYLGKIVDLFDRHNNTLPGEAYQAIRSEMETAARGLQHSDYKAAEALRGFKIVLDSALERGMKGDLFAQDLAKLKELRAMYPNLLVLERAATAVKGPGGEPGLVTPSALYAANKSVEGMRKVARGRGDLTPLAQAASDILRPYPSSGTAQRLALTQLPMTLAGTGYGAAYGEHPWDALKYGALGASPFLMGRA